MRIAIVNWSNRHVGGAETYISQILAALDAAGHTLALWHEDTAPADRPVIAVPAETLVIDGAWTRGDRGLRQLRDWAPDLTFVHGLVDPACERAVLDVAPAVLFAHGYYGTCITGSKTRTLPVVAPCDRQFGAACLAQFYPRRCGGRSPLTMWTEFRRQSARLDNLSRFAAVLVFSEHMRREYLRHGLPDSRLHRVPPIVTAAEAVPAAHRDRIGHRLLFAGRLDPLKGCRMLIESLPVVRARIDGPLELVIAGAGPDEGACREAGQTVMRADSKVTVTFRGWLLKAEASALLASADALVMPSLWPEPLGLAGLEATCVGVPVAAFAVGGIPEWLEDGVNGALAPGNPPTSEGLTTAIVRVLTDPHLTELTRTGRTTSLVSPVAGHVRQLESIFRGVVGTAAGDPAAGSR